MYIQIFAKFTLRIAAVISIASCLQQSNQPEPTSGGDTQIDTEQAKLLPNFSLETFLPPVSKITLPKLPAVPKRSTITLTTTVLTQETKHVTVYPTCARLRNIKSVCNGYLETILPTPIIPITEKWKETDSANYDSEAEDREGILPAITQPIQSTRIEDVPRKNIIEPSEYEYQYTASPDAIISSLPDESETRKEGNFLDKLLGPKYKIVTEHLTVTKVVQHINNAYTATVQVVNCLPPRLGYTLCDLEHIQPLVQSLKKAKNKQAVEQTVDEVYQQVDEFVLNNPHGVLGINPDRKEDQVYGALNSDSMPSISKTAEQFPASGRSIFIEM